MDGNGHWKWMNFSHLTKQILLERISLHKQLSELTNLLEGLVRRNFQQSLDNGFKISGIYLKINTLKKPFIEFTQKFLLFFFYSFWKVEKNHFHTCFLTECCHIYESVWIIQKQKIIQSLFRLQNIFIFG